jgi:hypothetical protein
VERPYPQFATEWIKFGRLKRVGHCIASPLSICPSVRRRPNEALKGRDAAAHGDPFFLGIDVVIGSADGREKAADNLLSTCSPRITSRCEQKR